MRHVSDLETVATSRQPCHFQSLQGRSSGAKQIVTNRNCCTAAYLFTYCCLLLPIICVAWTNGERKFQGARRPGSERAKERQFQGANWPGRVILADSLRGANWPGSEKAVNPLRLFFNLFGQSFSEPPMPTHNRLFSEPPTFGGMQHYLQSDVIVAFYKVVRWHFSCVVGKGYQFVFFWDNL